MRTYNDVTKRPASWGHMAIRHILIPMVPGVFFIFSAIASVVYEASYDYYYDYYTATDFSTGLSVIAWLAWLGFNITDLVMLANSPRKQGLKDKLAKTVVLDETYRL